MLGIAKRLFGAGLELLVIDTESKYISSGLAEELADVVRGASRLPPLLCCYLADDVPARRGGVLPCGAASSLPRHQGGGTYYYLPNVSEGSVAAAARGFLSGGGHGGMFAPPARGGAGFGKAR